MSYQRNKRPLPWEVKVHEIQVDEHGSTVSMYYIVDADGHSITENWLGEGIYVDLGKEAAEHIVRTANMFTYR